MKCIVLGEVIIIRGCREIMRICTKCGKVADDSTKYCLACGSRVEAVSNSQNDQNSQYQQGGYQQGGYQQGETKTVSPHVAQYANRALTFGIVGMCVPIFVFSILALKNSGYFYSASKGVGSGKAKAGKVLGIIGLIGSGLFIVYIGIVIILVRQYVQYSSYLYY